MTRRLFSFLPLFQGRNARPVQSSSTPIYEPLNPPYMLTLDPAPNTPVIVFINGLAGIPGLDYNVSGKTVTILRDMVLSSVAAWYSR